MQIRCTQADHQNQQIIGFCIDTTCTNQRPYCHFCLPSHVQHFDKLTSQELISGWIKDRILMVQYVQKNVQECKFALDSLINFFLPYNNFNFQQLPGLGLSQIDQFIKVLCGMGDCEEQLFKQLQESIKQTKSIVNIIITKIKNQITLKQNDNQLLQRRNIVIQISEQPKLLNMLEQNVKLFTFDLMKQYSIKQDEWCQAIAFNKDYSKVVAGCDNDIKTELNISIKCTLNFMKNTNNFVSGSFDFQIIIWQTVENQFWRCLQKLIGHSDSIFCLLLKNTDDLIISGNRDKTIKFWIKQDYWSCQQTITDHTDYVFSLSLNEKQNKLISCSNDSQILVIEQSKLNKKWFVTQKIQVVQFGLRLCFINDDQFTFQPLLKEQMDVYERDSNNKEYRKTKEIAVKSDTGLDVGLFPKQYLKSKRLLVNKIGNFINLMRKKQNGDFIIQQTIEFDNIHIYGQLSDDGEYLITWDSGSKEIQIRKFREL
ncbi:unnamed protein product [Paramecium pentaurelia]|uniref:Uncharacterized protein n=1 Tax=Paramecium pentaurelia TaxID=43138 RepID=A0A8S1VD84_9CILI|nr:unnamed protein product [Paramecium pentaurelia]